jgi:integrase
MRNIKMTASPRYPFSDLTPDELQALIAAARRERARAVHSFIARLLGLRRKQEAGGWTARGVPALGLGASN